MAESIRCPFCGGLNPADAQWCGQCLKPFPDAEPAPAADPTPVVSSAEGQGTAEADSRGPDSRGPDSPGTDGSAPAAASSDVRPAARTETTGGDAGDRPFAVSAEGITWTCPTCETSNPIEENVCSVCGTTFAQMVHPEPELADKDPNTAALISLFFPGAGHAYLGLWGDAIARGVLSLWVILVAIIAAFAGEQASGRLVTILFGLIAFGLWGVASHDAYRAARREKSRVILKGRGFLFLVLGLLGLLLLVLVGSALSARG